MTFDLERRAARSAGLLRSRQERVLNRIGDRAEVSAAYVLAAAEETIAVVKARDAIAAAAARADAVLSGMLNALPVYDVSDVDFKAQLKQVTRTGVVNDILEFKP